MSERRLKQLISLIMETSLNEEDNQDHAVDAGFSKGSFDAQVDKKLRSFVKDAKQVDDELDTIATPEDGDVSDAPEGEEPKKETPAQDLDYTALVQDVLDFIDNFDNLIEIKNTVLRRAIAFLKKTHGDEAVSNFKDALNETGSAVGVNDEEFEADNYKPSYAIGAGPGGTGA